MFVKMSWGLGQQIIPREDTERKRSQGGEGTRTGPKTPTSVTSKTFSIGALFGSAGGGLNSVDRSSGAMVFFASSL